MKNKNIFSYSFYNEDGEIIGVVSNFATAEEIIEIKKEKNLDYIIFEGEDNGK